jgi:hypothetical protein
MKKTKLKEIIVQLQAKSSKAREAELDAKREAMHKDLKLCKEILEKYGDVELEMEREQFGCIDRYQYQETFTITLNP